MISLIQNFTKINKCFIGLFKVDKSDPNTELLITEVIS